jgi:hypothetical protein
LHYEVAQEGRLFQEVIACAFLYMRRLRENPFFEFLDYLNEIFDTITLCHQGDKFPPNKRFREISS